MDQTASAILAEISDLYHREYVPEPPGGPHSQRYCYRKCRHGMEAITSAVRSQFNPHRETAKGLLDAIGNDRRLWDMMCIALGRLPQDLCSTSDPRAYWTTVIDVVFTARAFLLRLPRLALTRSFDGDPDWQDDDGDHYGCGPFFPAHEENNPDCECLACHDPECGWCRPPVANPLNEDVWAAFISAMEPSHPLVPNLGGSDDGFLRPLLSHWQLCWNVTEVFEHLARSHTRAPIHALADCIERFRAPLTRAARARAPHEDHEDLFMDVIVRILEGKRHRNHTYYRTLDHWLHSVARSIRSHPLDQHIAEHALRETALDFDETARSATEPFTWGDRVGSQPPSSPATTRGTSAKPHSEHSRRRLERARRFLEIRAHVKATQPRLLKVLDLVIQQAADGASGASDIAAAQQAGISRKTFYNHRDALEALWRELR